MTLLRHYTSLLSQTWNVSWNIYWRGTKK